MKPEKSFPLVGLAVPLFCAWQARDLITAWQHSPHDRLGWLALLVWLAPVARRVAGKARGKARAELAASFILMGAAIGCGLASELTELHFLGHVALALAMAGWLKNSWRSLLWLAAAVAWMPVFGWWLAPVSGALILPLRLALALVGAFCLWPVKKIES